MPAHHYLQQLRPRRENYTLLKGKTNQTRMIRDFKQYLDQVSAENQ